MNYFSFKLTISRMTKILRRTPARLSTSTRWPPPPPRRGTRSRPLSSRNQRPRPTTICMSTSRTGQTSSTYHIISRRYDVDIELVQFMVTITCPAHPWPVFGIYVNIFCSDSRASAKPTSCGSMWPTISRCRRRPLPSSKCG